jgi:YVTN family beta-propeller protein
MRRWSIPPEPPRALGFSGAELRFGSWVGGIGRRFRPVFIGLAVVALALSPFLSTASACAIGAYSEFGSAAGANAMFTGHGAPIHPLLSPEFPYVNSTISLSNGSDVKGNFYSGNGLDPSAIAFDNLTGQAFVGDIASGIVSILSDATDSVVGAIPGEGADNPDLAPDGIAFDSGRSEIFSTNPMGGSVSVISASSDSLVATIPVGSQPWGVAYDSGRGEVFVANSGSNTVSVINDTSDTVVATVHVGSIGPAGLAYDGAQGEVFVTGSASNDLAIISDSTNALTTKVDLGAWSVAVVYDPATDDVFVATPSTDNVTVLSGQNNSTVATIPVGTYPDGLAYDPSNGDILVANGGSDSVSAVSDMSNAVVANASSGSGPVGLAFDSKKGEIFADNSKADNVTVLSSNNLANVGSVSLGSNPLGMAYDNGKGELFVANAVNNSVSVVTDTTNIIIANITVGRGPTGLAYDSARGQVFVSNFIDGTVSVISDRSNSVLKTITVGSVPEGLVYDSGTGEVFVANSFSSTLSVIADKNDTVIHNISVGGYPDALAYDNSTGEIFVSFMDSGNVSVVSDSSDSVVANLTLWPPTVGYVAPYPMGLTYDPSAGAVFVSVYIAQRVYEISDTTNSVIATIDLDTLPEGIAFDNYTGELFVANNDTNNVSVISTASDSVVRSVPVGAGAAYVTYDSSTGNVYVSNSLQGTLSVLSLTNFSSTSQVVFNESGLPQGTPWSIILSSEYKSSTTSTIAFAELNGTYRFTVPSVGNDTPTSQTGQLNVSGAPVDVSVPFSSGPSGFYVVFQESGLPQGGTDWTVTLSGQSEYNTSSVIVFNRTNGSYTYSVGDVWALAWYAPSPSGGSLNVDGGGLRLNVTFRPTTSVYNVTFRESGLRSGAQWSTLLGGIQDYTTGNSITFFAANGSNSFTIGTSSGWTPSPRSGTVQVSGSAIAVNVTFTRFYMYSVHVEELGLTNGTGWGLNLNDTLQNATAPASISFNESNGSYRFSIAAVPGYSAEPSSGNISVDGSHVSMLIRFTSVPPQLYSIVVSESGLPNGTNWSANLSGGLAYSLTSEISFQEANGTYTLSVNPIANYSVAYQTSVIVEGASLKLEATFSNETYTLTLTEAGLPSGTFWSASALNPVTGATASGQSIASTLILRLLNGTYEVTVEGPPGYRASLNVSTVPVQGQVPTPVGVTFTSAAIGTVPPKGSSLDLQEVVGIGIAFVLATGAAIGLGFYRHGRFKAEAQEWFSDFHQEGEEHRKRGGP